MEMSRKSNALHLKRRQAHDTQQKEKRTKALADAQATAKSQKKGEGHVITLMERAGFQRVEKVVRVRNTGSHETRTVKLVSYKRTPQPTPQAVKR
jgi:hypothetical protein